MENEIIHELTTISPEFNYRPVYDVRYDIDINEHKVPQPICLGFDCELSEQIRPINFL